VANQDQVERLKQGVGRWNAWREANKDAVVDLSGAELPEARLPKANLFMADLKDANLRAANLSGADLYKADLSRTNLFNANLSGTDLRWAHLPEALLNGADLKRADLREANFPGAYLSRADLTGALLTGTTLNEADLRGAKGLLFDDNEVRNARFTLRPDRRAWPAMLRTRSGRAWLDLAPEDDPWSLLRRTYTGANLVLVTLALLVFLTPRLLAGVGLFLLAAAEEAVGAGTGAGGWVESPVWRVLLGLRGDHLGEWAGALLLVVPFAYNAGRFWLTQRVIPLRDAEERSGVTPALVDYQRLYEWHRRLVPLGVAALAAFVVNLGQVIVWVMTTRVTVPGR
jgi:hypothetical protein